MPIVFIPGLDGTVPPNFYSDTLGHLASHGYVIITMDTVVPLVGNGKLHKDEFLAKRVYEEVIWVSKELVALSTDNMLLYSSSPTWHNRCYHH